MKRRTTIMLTAKEAIQQAQLKAAELLSDRPFKLEEIEREFYKGRDAWDITLSYPLKDDELRSVIDTLAGLAHGNLQYRRFLIDVETGDLIAMKIRELSAR